MCDKVLDVSWCELGTYNVRTVRVCTVYSTTSWNAVDNAVMLVCCMLNAACSDHKDQSLDGFWDGIDAMNFQKFKCSRSTKFL